MHRPRNRQPRPPRNGTNPPSSNMAPRDARRQTAQDYVNVPSIQQVTSGARVSIVLKADQPTGRQVQGVVQDILTRGNHPRGIKVRLQDGRIGRVQQMASESAGQLSSDPFEAPRTPRSEASRRPPVRQYKMVQDVRNEPDYPSEPPPRSLADFLPDLDERPAVSQSPSVMVKCPICNAFEGDEYAVSRHVEEHLG